MYLPKTFEETDAARLQEFIRRHPLATLISNDANGLCADHIPMLVATGADGATLLRGHVARANPLWRNLGAGASVLAIFQDAGGYITPSWYATKAETGKVVPTWNYVAVHVQGSARAVDDSDWLQAFLTRLTSANESARAQPWKLTDAPAEFIAAQLKAIVGIEVQVAHMVGKWKASQNRVARDIDGVISGLRGRGDADSLRMAADVEQRRPR
ncbi:MAG: FMN-binding negative transcriptional regulator [Betaproteobacteria bacterium]|nr:FMN-binding negative transcriptional regulator [Betaproteobacteria bacterium]